MQFNGETNNLDIVSEVDALCSSNSTSYPIADKTRRANSALETLIGKILNIDGLWQWDDTNNSDLPKGTQTLVEGQSPYSFNDKLLKIENVKVKNASGDWKILTPLDQVEDRSALEERLDTNGMPTHYDKLGDTIYLYPAPDDGTSVTLASGLKIQYKRTASLFTVSDTTKVPGIASPWHITIAKMVALAYCKTYKKDRVAQLERDIAIETQEMLDFYSQRQKDVHHQFVPFKQETK